MFNEEFWDRFDDIGLLIAKGIEHVLLAIFLGFATIFSTTMFVGMILDLIAKF